MIEQSCPGADPENSDGGGLRNCSREQATPYPDAFQI